jgi:Yip1-like protein
MSTPPPPAPSSIPPQEPAQPALSEAARIADTFIAPRATFEDVRRKPSWFVPWLLSAIVSLIFAVVAVQKLDIPQLVRQAMEHSPMAQRRMEQLSPEQRERGIALQATISRVTFFLSPVLLLLIGIVIGAVLMGVFNFGFGAEVSFRHALAVTFYSLLPGIVLYVLLIISILVSSDPNSIDFASGNPIATSPAFFMDSGGNKFLYSIASSLDVIRIWEIILLGLGFAIVGSSGRRKLAPSTAIITIFGIYFAIALIRAGIASAF